MRVSVAVFVLAAFGVSAVAHGADSDSAPELTHAAPADWINSPPLTLAAMRDKAVLVEFWTFDCINCLNSLDWMKSISHRKSKEGLTIVAVHTPELAHEREPKNVAAAVKRLRIDYPVMLDRDFSYWNALHNEYWPAFYLIDKNGRLRAKIFGELHVGDRRTTAFEQEIERLLTE